VKAYTIPEDGFGWCNGCDYLKQVHTKMLLMEHNEMVPLCLECALRIGGK
jgi:hypothetical protein